MGIIKRFIKKNSIVQEYLSRGNILPIVEVEKVLEKVLLGERKRIFNKIKKWDYSGDMSYDIIKFIGSPSA